MHCPEKGHKENVRHEVYEQTQVRGTQWSAQCLQRAPDHAEPGAPVPGQFLVSFSKSLSDSSVLYKITLNINLYIYSICMT